MAMAQKAFEMVDKVYGKSHKVTPPPYAPRNEFASCFNQSSYEYGGPRAYTVKEATGTTNCHRVVYKYSNESTIREPVVSYPTEPIHFFGGARPFTGHPNRSEKPKGRPITCDEAFKLYGGVLTKEFHRGRN